MGLEGEPNTWESMLDKSVEDFNQMQDIKQFNRVCMNFLEDVKKLLQTVEKETKLSKKTAKEIQVKLRFIELFFVIASVYNVKLK